MPNNRVSNASMQGFNLCFPAKAKLEFVVVGVIELYID
jgi:hypothetical protein